MPVQMRPFPTRVFFCILTAALTVATLPAAAQQSQSPTQLEAPVTLVREVVYNELHDHEQHGWWRYWVEKHDPKETLLEEHMETSDGTLTRVHLMNGHPLDARGQQQEEARLQNLLNSPSQQASLKQAYIEDEKRIGRIVALLPDAFLYEDAGEENGLRHLHFRPNPDYPPHSMEARIFHAMSGDLWIDARMKHMARLKGQLGENVDFGFGILGRLYKGGWFELDRRQVGPADWKTERLEVHMNGRAMLFKTIARETSEVRGGFVPVPAQMSLTQGMHMLNETNTTTTASRAMAAAVFVKR